MPGRSARRSGRRSPPSRSRPASPRVASHPTAGSARGTTSSPGASSADAGDEWTIEKLVPGGDGFTRLADGRSAFAAGALPGDRIRPRSVENHASYLRATSWELIEPSVDRVPVDCASAHECGGCDWMTLSRDAELRAKVALLTEALRRVGGQRELPISVVPISAGPALGYRGRLRVHVDADGRLGLYARGSRQLVVIPTCAVARTEINQALARVRELGERHEGSLRAFSEIELRHAPLGPAVSVWLQPRVSPGQLPRAFLDALSREYAVHISGQPAPASGAAQRWPLPGGVELSAPPGAFTQVNWAVNERLVEFVVEGALRRGARTFCDLYCGAGNFSLPLLAAGLAGVAIEADGPAIVAARGQAESKGLDATSFRAGRVEAVVERLVREGQRYDCVLIDPPRAGAKAVMSSAARLARRQLVLIGCDPVTSARDLKLALEQGFVLEEAVMFDMFPRTHHFETLLWLARVGA